MAEKRKNIAVRRTAQVLKSFAQNPDGWGISALAHHLGLAKSVVFEILNTLVDEGLFKKDEKEKVYLCGNELLRLALTHFGSIELIKVSRPVLKKLSKELGETTLLIQLVEDENIVIEKFDGVNSIRFVINVGTKLPLDKGSSAKVWLAFLPDKEREKLINTYKIDFTKLREEIETVREKGYSTSKEEVFADVKGVAVPIFNNYSELVAVISVGGPAFRYNKNLIPKILGAAKEISFQIGCLNWKW